MIGRTWKLDFQRCSRRVITLGPDAGTTEISGTGINRFLKYDWYVDAYVYDDMNENEFVSSLWNIAISDLPLQTAISLLAGCQRS
ncbi:hypothetical protein SAMN05216516_102138 [Izhakiella capsodis]|uniref:Uncharacterized protein n=1 Tax=Izhakiella capsodis TaxID=1367852 RepID=A0A1I4VXU8_9GAMM|nr:hypothetical protein SAMN05216516_102138 [Izhakiella capsodis]